MGLPRSGRPSGGTVVLGQRVCLQGRSMPGRSAWWRDSKEATVGQWDEAGRGREGRKVGGRAQNTRA